MQVTSAQANKLLKKLQQDSEELLLHERQSSDFIAATTEDLESARPPYNYRETQEKLAELDRQIRAVKHAISLFNLTHEVEGFGMTVDQLLVYIPQLTNRKNKLYSLANTLDKTRLTNSPRINLIEYRYANYDVEQAKADYDQACEELARAQLALDRLNTTELLEIDL